MAKKTRLAGYRHMVVVLASLFLLALLIRRRMALFATHFAEMATRVSARSAGRTALKIGATMALTAKSRRLMDVALVQSTSAIIARSGEPFGTRNAVKASTTWAAAFAHPTAQLTCTISVCLVINTLTVALLELPLPARLRRSMMLDFAIPLVSMVQTAKDQSVGAIAPLAQLSVEPSA